MQTKYQHKRII